MTSYKLLLASSIGRFFCCFETFLYNIYIKATHFVEYTYIYIVYVSSRCTIIDQRKPLTNLNNILYRKSLYKVNSG